MTLLDDYKKKELLDRLLKSAEKLQEESKISEEDRVCVFFNTPAEIVEEKLAAHKKMCREKYGTDEGIDVIDMAFVCDDETLRRHPEIIGKLGTIQKPLTEERKRDEDYL